MAPMNPRSIHACIFLTRRLALAIVWLSVLLTFRAEAENSTAAQFKTVTIDNANPRRDVSGEIIDAHDGCLQFFEGRYYLYGTAYGKSAGFSINNRFRVYSSADLVKWSFEGELLQSPPDGVYYRPYVAFNPKTRKYVLWYNWYPKLWDGQIGAATSDTPVGPFTIANANVQVSQAKSSPGDGSLFVDDDGTGYFIYTVIGQDHAIRVERLTSDYLGSAGQVSEILAKGCESPSIFKRKGVYYALFDFCCCFCSAGSGARILTAPTPLGPFTERTNINRQTNSEPIIAAQQTWVATLPTREGPAHIWMGDRWGSRPDGIKGHDFQFWSAPLQFSADGDVLPLKNDAKWQADLRIGIGSPARTNLYSWPKKKDPNAPKTDPCSNRTLSPIELDGLE